MTTNAIGDLSKISNLTIISLAILASVELRFARADGSGYSLFPNRQHDQCYRSLGWHELNACPKSDRYRLIDQSLTCSDLNNAGHANRSKNNLELVNNAVQGRSSQSLN